MEQSKKKINWFKITLILFFVAYISLYVLNVTGYYDGSIRRKVEFTNEQIAKFEEDVKEGKEIDLNEYLKDQNKNYTNSVSRLGYTISSSVDTFLNEGIKNIVHILGKFFS